MRMKKSQFYGYMNKVITISDILPSFNDTSIIIDASGYLYTGLSNKPNNAHNISITRETSMTDAKLYKDIILSVYILVLACPG